MRKSLKYILFVAIIILASCSKKEPQNPEEVFSKYKNEQTLEGKIRIYENFIETNPESDLIKSLLYNVTNRISDEKGIISASDFLMDNQEFANTAIYNSLAWKIYESGENLELGASLAATGVEKVRNDLIRIKDTKPENMSEEEWRRSLNQSLAMVLDTYGCIERALGNDRESLASFEEAVKLMEGKFPEVNENYIAALIVKGDYENAKSLLTEYIVSGKSTVKMQDQLKEVFVKLGNSETDFYAYLAKLKNKVSQRIINELKGELKNEPAKYFELNDLEGNVVQLTDYKGKTVILDFWATWCRPCLQSFPGMKKAVEKFSSDPDVKFLFVNTRERVEDKKKNAIEFIQENNYPFHVLLDNENKVVEQYSVRGIPTKFIIDKDQNIRFESIGYEGNEEELVEELSIMISMIK